LSIDKSEEYSLISFILTYKNIQFLTAGCLSAMFGYFQYFYCATYLPSVEAKEAFVN
jgi:hypothetical protein